MMKSASVKHVAIIGVGFMGGSLCKALKRKFPGLSVVGFARSGRSLRRLRRLKLLDRVETDLARAVAAADFVVLAQPVGAIIASLREIGPLLKKGSVVFDLGSTKQGIEEAAKRFIPDTCHFVGCHPLCGSEKSGPLSARHDLYRGAVVIITSPRNAQATRAVAALWRSLGSNVVFMDPVRHDAILSRISHLPHVISFSLAELVPSADKRFASGSFKDMTRIARSPAEVWADIFLSNRQHLVRDLDAFIALLTRYRADILARKKNALCARIDAAHKKIAT